MKVLMMSLFLLLSFQIVNGQDKIITIERDTVLCQIVSVSPASIHYEQKSEYYPGEVRRYYIPTKQVLEYVWNDQWHEIDPNILSNSQMSTLDSPWVIGVQVGGASLLASSARNENALINIGLPKAQASDYYKRLKQGWSFNGDVHYLLSDYFGLGAKYSFFTSSVQSNFLIKTDDYFPDYASIEMKEKLYIHYVGPSVIFQQWLDEDHDFQLTETVSGGYVHYRDEMRMHAVANALAESNTWGINAGLSADYYPASWLSIGLQAGFMYVNLNPANVSIQETMLTGGSTSGTTPIFDFKDKTYHDFSRIDYLLSIRFHF